VADLGTVLVILVLQDSCRIQESHDHGGFQHFKGRLGSQAVWSRVRIPKVALQRVMKDAVRVKLIM
jgi:hypothetical protein